MEVGLRSGPMMTPPRCELAVKAGTCRRFERGQPSVLIHMEDWPLSVIDGYLGLTIEPVSRTLSKFKQSGLVIIPTLRTIEIMKRTALEISRITVAIAPVTPARGVAVTSRCLRLRNVLCITVDFDALP